MKDGFTGWTITKNFGVGWRIEEVPLGWEPDPDLPTNPEKGLCFGTANGWCAMNYLIDLDREGLTTQELRDCVPFKIKLQQSYGAGRGWEGALTWSVALLDANKRTVISDHRKFFFVGEGQWKTLRMLFNFEVDSPNVKDKLDAIRYLEFTVEGRGNPHQVGHYGPKFANAEVIFEQEIIIKKYVIFVKPERKKREPKPKSSIKMGTQSSKNGKGKISAAKKLRRSPRILKLQKKNGAINYKE